MAYELDLPVGARVRSGADTYERELVHLGNGMFRCDLPVWIIEGITQDDSPSARGWPCPFHLRQVAEPVDLPSHKRVGLGMLSGEPESPF